MKTYHESPSKRYIQNLIYSNIKNIRSSMLTLLGPTPGGFLQILNKYPILSRRKDRLISYECDPTNYAKQKAFILHDKYYRSKSILVYGDLLSAANLPLVVDLDLMRSIKKEALLIKTLFNRQIYYNNDKLKVFNFTVASRGSGIKLLLDFLKELLQLEDLEVIDKTCIQYGTEYKLVHTGKYYIKLYGYRDSATMFSVSIQYK